MIAFLHSTQESPQEQGWRSGSTPYGLNLEANKVDHFSQANHPRIRTQIEATITGRTTSNQRIVDTFKVN